MVVCGRNYCVVVDCVDVEGAALYVFRVAKALERHYDVEVKTEFIADLIYFTVVAVGETKTYVLTYDYDPETKQLILDKVRIT